MKGASPLRRWLLPLGAGGVALLLGLSCRGGAASRAAFASVDPPDGSRGVPLNALVHVTLLRPADPATVRVTVEADSGSATAPVDGRVFASAGATDYAFVARGLLAPGATYRVSVAAGGQSMTSRFTTDPNPIFSDLPVCTDASCDGSFGIRIDAIEDPPNFPQDLVTEGFGPSIRVLLAVSGRTPPGGIEMTGSAGWPDPDNPACPWNTGDGGLCWRLHTESLINFALHFTGSLQGPYFKFDTALPLPIEGYNVTISDLAISGTVAHDSAGWHIQDGWGEGRIPCASLPSVGLLNLAVIAASAGICNAAGDLTMRIRFHGEPNPLRPFPLAVTPAGPGWDPAGISVNGVVVQFPAAVTLGQSPYSLQPTAGTYFSLRVTDAAGYCLTSGSEPSCDAGSVKYGVGQAFEVVGSALNPVDVIPVDNVSILPVAALPASDTFLARAQVGFYTRRWTFSTH